MTAHPLPSKYQRLRTFVGRITLTQWLLIFIAFLLLLNHHQQSDLDDRLTSLADDMQSGHSNIESKISDLSSDLDDVKTKLDSIESDMP